MSLAILILIIAAVAGSVGITLAFTLLFLRTRGPQLQGGSPNDLRLLQNEVQRLAEELDRTGDEVERLRVRMDFTEKLLGPGE